MCRKPTDWSDYEEHHGQPSEGGGAGGRLYARPAEGGAVSGRRFARPPDDGAYYAKGICQFLDLFEKT